MHVYTVHICMYTQFTFAWELWNSMPPLLDLPASGFCVNPGLLQVSACCVFLLIMTGPEPETKPENLNPEPCSLNPGDRQHDSNAVINADHSLCKYLYAYINIRTHIHIHTNTHDKHRQHPSNAAINADHSLRDSQRVKRPPPLHPRLTRPPLPSLNRSRLCRLHVYHLSITLYLSAIPSLSVCLSGASICQRSVNQSVCPVCLSVCLSVCHQSIRPSIFICLSVRQSGCLSICLSSSI